MFYHLIRKEFIGATILVVVFGVFLYFLEPFTEQVISKLLGYAFYYNETPFLKLIYLLLLAVTMGVFSAIQKTAFSSKKKQELSSGYLLTLVVFSLIGLVMHGYFVVTAMTNEGSLVQLEENLFKYYATDIFLVMGFLVAGLKLRKELYASN